MRAVLVTGKNSYIGNAWIGYAESHYPGAFQICAASLRDGTWRDLDFGQFDTVFHVAGIAHADVGRASEAEKREYYAVNTDLALEVAGRAKAAGVGQFLLMSSMIVYGGQERVTEETEPDPANFYGDSKWRADCGVRQLADEGFRVAVLRPPMVYGRGSRGNYPVLARLAKKLPVFPEVKNKRSMLYIETLCEFLCRVILEGRGGIFFPQNRELAGTGELVREIAVCAGHRIWVTPLLAPAVWIGKRMPGKIGDLCGKAFGSSYYDPAMSEMEWDYRVADLRESVRRTERGDAEEGMRHFPLVSITTATRNSEATLARTIESVLAQTYDAIEYLVIDGCSGDRTVEIAEGYRERFAARGFAYTVVSEADHGMYDAINKGIRLSHGEILGNINSDDWYEPSAVEKAVRALEERGLDYVYADLRMVGPDGGSFVKRAKLQKLATSRGWNHPTQFARREVHLKYPYKVESLHDDFDFFLKVRRSGFRVGVLGETLANFTMEGISHGGGLRAAVGRGKCRYRIYRNNGCSRWYLLECILIEAAKLLLSAVSGRAGKAGRKP